MRLGGFFWGVLPIILQVAHGVGVPSMQQVSSADVERVLHRVGDGAGGPGVDSHGEESDVDYVPLGQAKGDIAGAEVDIDAELASHHFDCTQGDGGGFLVCANG